MALILTFIPRETTRQAWKRLEELDPWRAHQWSIRTGKDVPTEEEIERDGLRRTPEELKRIQLIERQLIERGISHA